MLQEEIVMGRDEGDGLAAAQTTTTKPKQFKWFIGTDVSRNELDFAVMKGKKLLFHAEIKKHTG